MPEARFLRIRGVVQGVGFRPFVFRLAQSQGIKGWVRNGAEGVEIHAEADSALESFARALQAEAPPEARIASFEMTAVPALGYERFEILESTGEEHPTVRISADLPICDACLAELFDPGDRRYGYPYINCTDCGPRYTIVLGLPYDRPRPDLFWLHVPCSRVLPLLSYPFRSEPRRGAHRGPTHRGPARGRGLSGEDRR